MGKGKGVVKNKHATCCDSASECQMHANAKQEQEIKTIKKKIVAK